MRTKLIRELSLDGLALNVGQFIDWLDQSPNTAEVVIEYRVSAGYDRSETLGASLIRTIQEEDIDA